MARVRNLKPGFFSNEDLAECGPWTRLCFAGLWTIADREGRLEDRPKRIKGQLFPMDAIEIDPILDELERHHFIQRYAVNVQGFIQIIAFSKHQNPHHREPSSVIPSPKSPGLLSDNDGMEALGQPEALPPSSVIPSPQSRAEPGTQNKEQGQNTLARQAERLFADQFWPAYPRKVGRENAVKAFVKLKPDAELLGVMLKALAAQAASDQWQREAQYIPHAATWINGKRWQDDAGGDHSMPDYLARAV